MVGVRFHRSRALRVAATCAVVLATVVACTQQTTVAPLREDPELAAVLNARKDAQELLRTARRLTSEGAAALEADLVKNPGDKASREMLLAYYQWPGRKGQTREALLAASRPHALWLIEHEPDSHLLESGRVSTDTGTPGYAQARALWLAQIAKPDVSAATLGNAAAFFTESEPPMAEQLLLRTRALQSRGGEPRTYTDDIPEWNLRLGMLYAAVIERDHPHARKVREKLETSTDAAILHATGFALWVPYRSGRDRTRGRLDSSRAYVERAARLDSPYADAANRFLKNMDPSACERLLVEGSATLSRKSSPDLLAKSFGPERLRLLVSFADQEYLSAEYLDWRARQPESSAFRSKDPGAPARRRTRARRSISRLRWRAPRSTRRPFSARTSRWRSTRFASAIAAPPCATCARPQKFRHRADPGWNRGSSTTC